MPDFGENFVQALKHADTLYMSQRDDDIQNLATQFGYILLTVLPKSLRLTVQVAWPFVTGLSNVAGNNVEFSIDELPCKNFTLSASLGRCATGK